MSIYCTLIHRNSTVKHIYIKFVFLLHRAFSLAILYGSGSHQSPPGEHKMQLYHCCLSAGGFSVLQCLPQHETLLMDSLGQGQTLHLPDAAMRIWAQKGPAKAGGGKNRTVEWGFCLLLLKEYSERGKFFPFEDAGIIFSVLPLWGSLIGFVIHHAHIYF